MNIRNHLHSVVTIFLGTTLISIGINGFAIPAKLAEGGFTGIGLLINYSTGLPLSYLLIILNLIPLFFGYKILGKKSFCYSIIGIVFLSLILELTQNIGEWINLRDDILLSALYAGAFIGIGCGMIFRAGGTTGGLDIIAQIIYRKKNISIGTVIISWDLLVLLLSMFIINPRLAMYTLVEMIIVSRIIDFIVEGMRTCRTATIISNEATILKKALTQEIGRGVTILKGQGAYTGNQKEVLYIVFAPREFPKLKELIDLVDPKAFMVIHNARDVRGEGFS